MVDWVSLDDRDALSAADPGNMFDAIGALGRQLRSGYEIGGAARGLPDPSRIRAVVIGGMGGSGIAGDVLSALYGADLAVPLVVVKDRVLPGFSGPGTLVIVVSYSGDTEETASLFDQARARSAAVVTISSGGRLAARSATEGAIHVRIPSDVSMPRAAIGYLAGGAMGVLHATGLTAAGPSSVDATAALLEALGAELGPGSPEDRNEAKTVARWMNGRVPLVWGAEGCAAAARRWKTQINENAKMPAFFAAFPELAHNEIEALATRSGERLSVVLLRTPMSAVAGSDHQLARAVGAVATAGVDVREVWARGGSAADHLFSLIMLGDFASAYLAVLRGVDPTPVPVLTGLKERSGT